MYSPPDPQFPPPPAPASIPRNAGRPRFALTDDEARSPVMQLGDLRTRHADNPRQHRQFVHDFLRAVHHATGRVYSAGTHRKLLQAYAPERTPSTTTLETEKNLLEHELKSRSVSIGIPVATPLPAAEAAPSVPSPAPTREARLELQQIIGLLHHLSARLDQQDRAFAGQDRSAGLQAHNDYLRERLAVTEEELSQTRARRLRRKLPPPRQRNARGQRTLRPVGATTQRQGAASGYVPANVVQQRSSSAMTGLTPYSLGAGQMTVAAPHPLHSLGSVTTTGKRSMCGWPRWPTTAKAAPMKR